MIIGNSEKRTAKSSAKSTLAGILLCILLITLTKSQFTDFKDDCSKKSCISCPETIDKCEECDDGWFLLTDKNTCRRCPSGCSKCESSVKCTSCSSLKELKSDKCVFKKLVLYSGIGGIVVVIFLCIGVCWFADKKM